MEGAAPCSLKLLGRATLVGPGGTRITLRSKQVAAALAMLWDEARPVRRDELAELFWGEERLPDHWAGAVRGVIAKARSTLERAGFDRAALHVAGGTVQLHLPGGAVTDLDEAVRLVEATTTALRAGEPARAHQLAQEAVGRLAEPLAVQGEGDWIRRLHLRISTHAGVARRALVEALIGLGHFGEAVAAADAAILADPLDEVAHELLIRAHLAAGRPAAARRAQTELARVLRDELGIEPDPAPVVGIGARATMRRLSPSPARDEVGSFLGRIEELSALGHEAAEVVASGRPALAIVEGPAGIGKTRLVRAFLAQREVRFLWGRCHAESGVAFEPFADAFRHALAGSDASFELLGDSVSAGLRRLLPEVTGDNPGEGDDRAVVVRDVVQTIAAWASDELLVLVIDDVQWASGDTLALVSRVLEDADVPVLVVLTVREEAAEPGALAEVLRAAPATVLPLAGIAAIDLLPLADELLTLTGDGWARDGLAQHLRERTGGLPYYLTELARDARRQQRLDPAVIPEPVRAWVRRRVEALPEELVSLLEIAAVVGARPAVDLVEACADASSERTVRGLERLARTGLLVETTSSGHLAFPHQITREVVEAGIGSTRRARLHGRVAAALAARGAGDPPHALLAHHLSQAGSERRGAAVLHGFQAGAASLARSAWDLADDQLTTALGQCPNDEPILRASLLVALGRTRHVRGRPDEAVAFLDEAVVLATEHRLPHHLARAALQVVGRGGRGAALGMDDAQREHRLREALVAVRTWTAPPGVPSALGFEVDDEALATLRTALEVELAWALLFSGSLDERRALVEGALARARGDRAGPGRLARALVAQRNVLQGPGDLALRLAQAAEVLALPEAEVSADALMAAHLGRHEDLLGLGDRDGARAALECARRVADRHGHPYWRWAAATWEALWHLIGGDPDTAEVALGACAALQPAGSPEVVACQAVQLVAIRLYQGRAEEVLGGLAVSAEVFPEIPCYRAVWALCLMSAGDLDGAEAVYRPFAESRFESIPVDSNRLLAVAALGDVAATLGDVDGAAVLDELLAPDDHLHVVLNCYGGGGAYWGPVSRIRGRLAEVRGRHADAEAAFGRAARAAELLGAPLPETMPGWEAFADRSPG